MVFGAAILPEDKEKAGMETGMHIEVHEDFHTGL